MTQQAAEWFRAQGVLHINVLVGTFILVALWETFSPGHPHRPNGRRWALHVLLAVMGNALAMAVLPVTAVFLAASIDPVRWGLFNAAWLPYAVRFVLAFLFLDLVRYAQHYCYHAIPSLWRLHSVHHADPDFDLTTGFRFHPFEMLLTQATYLAAIALTAPPPEAVLALELAVVAQNFFAHANVRLPAWLNTFLVRFVITPNLHSIHHSIAPQDQQSNFGTLFPWWDRLFGTLHVTPELGPEAGVGLAELREKPTGNLVFLLALPFRRVSWSLTPKFPPD